MKKATRRQYGTQIGNTDTSLALSHTHSQKKNEDFIDKLIVIIIPQIKVWYFDLLEVGCV